MSVLFSVLGLNLVQLNSVSSSIPFASRTSMRFSLRDLMLLVAFWAGIAWCAAQVGFDNGLFWFVIGASAVLSGLFVIFMRAERGRQCALVVLVPVLALSFLSASISLLFNSALLSIATVVLAGRDRASIRTLWAIAGATTLASLLAVVIPLTSYMRELEEAHRAMPTVSLANRLKYESRMPPTDPAQSPTISTSVLEQLQQFEHQLGGARAEMAASPVA